MKKRFLTLIFTIATMFVSIFGLSACGMVEFKVNFVVDGVVYDTINTNGEEIIKMPENPTKDEYTFDGWFWDKDTWQTPFTANSLLDAPLSSDMNVYCKWKANTVNVESVSLDKTEISLHENDVTYLTATVLPENATDTSVVWESSNSTIATVVGGKVTALRIGSATITATTKDGGKIATCAVYVEPITVESVTLNHTALSLLHGESKTLTATVLPSNATEKGVLWQSSNSSVVTVEKGTMKAVGYGTATITVTTVDGNKKATCSVEVIEDKITFNTLAVDGESVYGKVSNDTTTFSFIREITEHGNAAYQIYKEITCETLIASKSISLNIGDNTVYVLQTVGKDLKLYTVTVRRRPMYDVTFNVNGGTSVEKQVIEEDYLATEPTTTRAGYTFTGWDYDFTTPITQDTTVNAGWTAHTDTPYKVEYYLQNLDNDEYTLELTENKTGKTDTTANAEIKTFAHFTHTASATDSGNINGEGSRVLKVYYKRDIYTVTFAGNGGTLVAGAEIQTVKYGGSVNAPTYQRTGYTFTGYDKPEFANISESFTATAKWKINQYTLTIVYNNGQEDKVITQDYNTKIESIADPEREGYDFIGWDKTMPTEMPAENMTITAKWKINQYTLTIVYGNGQEDKVLTQDYNSEIESIADPEREGYDFIGWDNTIPAEMPAENMTITAKWKINQYTLTIVYGNGQTDKVVTQDYNTEIESIANPERAGYDFDCWDKMIPTIMPAENVTVTAQWQSIYTLSNGTITRLTDYGKTNYTKLDIPSEIDGVEITSIGESAFYNCDSLTSVVIPDSVTSIGAYAFDDCDSLTSVVIPDSVTSIGDWAFYSCDSLTSVKIGDGVTFIGDCAFYYCDSLTSVTIPDSVTSIGNSAFYYCDSLTSVTIPDSVTSIGTSAFYRCTALTEINYNATECANLSYDNNVFYNAGKNGGGFGVTIGANVKKIPAHLFHVNSTSNAPKITSVVFAKGSVCESIGVSAFSGCESLIAVYISSIEAWCNISFASSSANPLNCAKNLYLNKNLVTELEIPNTITEIKAYAFYNCDSLTSVVIGDGVTSIGDSAFSGCDSLTSVVIGDGVTSIGSYAFYYCDSLTSVEIGDSVTFIGDCAFYYCDSLTSVTIPDSVTSIGNSAFYYCDSLTSVTIPDSVTSIGNSAFYYCDSLTSVVIGDNVTSIGNSAFNGCSGLVRIIVSEDNTAYASQDGILYNKEKVEIIHVPKKIAGAVTLLYGINSIGDSAFNGCSGLTSIEIPDSVTSIDRYAFYNCYSLTSVKIGDGVTSIGSYAFAYCYGLTSITIPDSVTSIGSYAFAYCYGLTSITIPDSVTSIGSYVFAYCYSLTSVVIGDSVTSINGRAFYDCSSLTSVVIGDSVTSIDGYAFYNCSNLTSIEIPDSVTSIDRYAFYNCYSLTSVKIGDGVTFIGDCAFCKCYSLTSVYYKGTEKEWGAISIIGWDNILLINATRYYYSEEQPTKSGIYWYYDENGNVAVW